MIKKIQVIVTIILMMGMIFLSLGKVEAHSVELDPKSLISFPMMISNGKGKITIKSSETGYSLYYQAVEISDATYEQIEQTANEGKIKYDAIKKEMDTLKKELDDLKIILDKAYEAYKEKLDAGVTGTELETLKTAWETARTNYQNKANEYNDKLKEYNDKINEVDAKIKELTPSYVESNWTKTEDGSFTIDISKFSGKRTFAVWAKLISSDGTISYDEATYTTSGTKTEEIPKQEDNSQKDTNQLITSNKKQNDNTVSAKKLPDTGVSKAIIISILIMLLIVVISYKKYDNYKKIK